MELYNYVPSSCTDPIQATACLLTVLVNRIQKSGSGDNNFVKWKRDISVQMTKTTRPVKEDHLQSCSWIFWSNQCTTEMYGILGWMESTLTFPFDLFNTSWTPGYAPVKRQYWLWEPPPPQTPPPLKKTAWLALKCVFRQNLQGRMG